jgi:hypothetical protein
MPFGYGYPWYDYGYGYGFGYGFGYPYYRRSYLDFLALAAFLVLV